MGRELRRVPVDFDWPLYKVWGGFAMPEHLQARDCKACGGSGLNPATRQLREDWYDLDGFGSRWTYDYGKAPDGRPADRPPWRIRGETRRWCYALTQDEVDALVAAHRLHDLTSTFVPGEGWKRREDVHPTAAEVNAWAERSWMGHDSINQWVCVETRAKRLGVYGQCDNCGGEGCTWWPGQKEAHDAWEPMDPPTGDAYQIWETVSEGSPISPPFAEPADLARWMSENDRSITRDMTREDWLRFIAGPGWAPSMVSNEDGLQSGAKAAARRDDGMEVC